jgi:hypothetical protein
MAPSQESINQLRYQLATSRAGLTRATSVLGASLDVPGRVRQEVAAHPLKWAMVAIVGGVVASRVLPVALRLVQTAASRRLVGTVVATLAPLAVRAGVNALAARRPDLLEAFMGGAAPASAQPPPSSSFGG